MVSPLADSIKNWPNICYQCESDMFCTLLSLISLMIHVGKHHAVLYFSGTHSRSCTDLLDVQNTIWCQYKMSPQAMNQQPVLLRDQSMHGMKCGMNYHSISHYEDVFCDSRFDQDKNCNFHLAKQIFKRAAVFSAFGKLALSFDCTLWWCVLFSCIIDESFFATSQCCILSLQLQKMCRKDLIS